MSAVLERPKATTTTTTHVCALVCGFCLNPGIGIKMEVVARFLCQQGDEQFHQALKLSDEDSKHDPESDPYKSKYKARELWHELKKIIEEYRDDQSDEGNRNEMWIFLIAALNLLLGKNYSETEESASGEEHIEKCVDALTSHRLDSRGCNVLQHAYNELGVIWANRSQPKKAILHLRKAEELFEEFTKQVGGAPHTISELFSSDLQADAGIAVHKRKEDFENTYTHTLYYLAQMYGQIEEQAKSARYCHVTLCRQLKNKSYTPVDWALNAATLSQYYITHLDFAMARHCLASAFVILGEAGHDDKSVEVDPVESDATDKLSKVWADVYRCCIKYGLRLMESSWSRLLEANCDDVSESEPRDSQDVAEAKNNDCMFDLELTAFESSITDKFVLNFEQCRHIFLVVQKWINQAKEYYTLNDHCNDYVEITQDYSTLFKLLSYFEMDYERQCKMHKRRIDMLQAVLNELNPQFYLLICRQIMFELAETYSAILDLKLSAIEHSQNAPTQHALHKINLLAQKSLDQYSAYLDSLRNPEKQLPNAFDEDDERPALIAHFCSGRLHSKFIEHEIAKRVVSIKKAIQCYNFVVEYCKRNPLAKEKVSAELNICQDMIALLPAKIAKLESGEIQ